MKNGCNKRARRGFLSVLLSFSMLVSPIETSAFHLSAHAAENASTARDPEASEDVRATSSIIPDTDVPKTAEDSETASEETAKSEESREAPETAEASGMSDRSENQGASEEAAESKSENPFGLKDEDMPLSRSDVPMLLSEDAEEDEDTDPSPDEMMNLRTAAMKHFTMHYPGDSFAFAYTSVDHEQKEFTVTKDMACRLQVLSEPYQCERDGVSYYGVRVLSVVFTISESGESGEVTSLDFYADAFPEEDVYISADMVFGNGDRFTDRVLYCEDPDHADAAWTDFKDVNLHGGMLTLQLRSTSGAYIAPIEAGMKAAKTGKAVIIAVDGDETLGNVPMQDAEALQLTLLRTNQFKEEDVTIIDIPAAEADSQASHAKYKEQVWECIDEIAANADNELTLIAYSGHGNYASDGGSMLSLGGDNSITAAELKKHVSALHGRVILLFDSCFSGGMLMPTSLDGAETEAEDTSSAADAAQQEADAAIRSFVQDFRAADAAAAVTETGDAAADAADTERSRSLEYYIYAAASPYETSMQGESGQLVEAFGCALGYYRKDAAYDVFSADRNADYEVSAKELAEYVKGAGTTASPYIYYPSDRASAALFSYDASAGRPAAFSVKTVGDENVSMDADGRVTVRVKVTNHSDEPVEFDAAAMHSRFLSSIAPGAVHSEEYTEENRQCIYYEDGNRYTVEAGTSEAFDLHFTDESRQYFSEGGRFLLKLWGAGDTDSMYYAVTDFYIGAAERAEAADKDALCIRKPAQTSEAQNAAQASSYIPLNVSFDSEPTSKSGYAALTLTARAWDLGTDAEGYTLAEDGMIRTETGDAVPTDDTSKWITIYENVRPTYQRDSVYSGEKLHGSYYVYAWDVSALPRGHYYALTVSSQHDDGTVRSRTTFVRITDKEEADAASLNIGEQFLDMSYFAKQLRGIEQYRHRSDGRVSTFTADTAAKQLAKYLNKLSESYDVGSAAAISFEVNDQDSSGWFTVSDDGLTEMDPKDTFEAGKDYVSRITMTIDDGYHARFSKNTIFRIGGHTLYTADPEHVSGAQEDGKTAVLYVLHHAFGLDPSGIKVCKAGTKEELTKDTVLQAGDQIDIYTGGYKVGTNQNSSLSSEAEKGDGYLRYTVKRSSQSEIWFWIYDPKSGAEDEDCGCATIIYKFKLQDTEDSIKSISAPDKTFYAIGETLDLTGAEVTYYEAKEEELSDVISDGAVLVRKDGEQYTAWSDDMLRSPGIYKLYLCSEGRYFEAFDVAAGYVQGDAFRIDGSFSYNTNGSVFYLKDTERQDVVLQFGVAQNGDGDSGVLQVEHHVLATDVNVNASELSDLHFTKGAFIQYRIPYPEGLSKDAYTYAIVDEEKNVPVKLTLREDGLWITAERNGSYRIHYERKEKTDPEVKPEPAPDPVPEPTPSPTPSPEPVPTPEETEAPDADTSGAVTPSSDTTGHSTGRTGDRVSGGSIGLRAYGSWQSEMAADHQLRWRFRLTDGAYARGWQRILYKGREQWFFFDSDGYMHTGWLLSDQKWYYLGSDGAMHTGWVYTLEPGTAGSDVTHGRANRIEWRQK